MKKFKFALIGTSCCGKTTATLGIVSRLKQYGILADGVFNQDRKFSFDRALVETEESAQNWMINNIIAKEVDIGLHSDVEVLVSDRSALDLYAYYSYQYDTALSKACGKYVEEWAKTYDALYYLPTLPFQDDSKRPSEGFRIDVDNHLVDLIQHGNFPNVKFIDRSHILNDILKTIGFVKPGVKTRLTLEDIKALSKSLQRSIVYKPGDLQKEDPTSDHDLYIIVNNPLAEDYNKQVEKFIREQFGPFVSLDISFTNIPETLLTESKFAIQEF